jgi:mono/diheme cytochrome c family protein
MRRSIQLLLGWALFALATCVWAQSSKPGSSFQPNPKLSDQEKRGEYLFLQRCALCHVMKYGREVSTPRLPPVWWNLEGLFKDAEPDQAKTVREFILKGTQRMPGWQYTLEPRQIDDLIAYLKTL